VQANNVGMQEQAEAAPTTNGEEPAKKHPWYTLDPRAIKQSRLLRAILVALVLANFQIAPVWRLLWHYDIPNRVIGLVHARGLPEDASRWPEGKAIYVYQLPFLPEGRAEIAAKGVRALVEEAGLDFRVEVRPMTEEMMEAYDRTAETVEVPAGEEPLLDVRKLEKELVALRGDNQHADVLVMNVLMADAEWAVGKANCFSGVAVLHFDGLNESLAKHEACHLMGYSLHDRMPLFILGYGWEGWPWRRTTLMGLTSLSDDLSPRARDALRSYWAGMEKRTGRRYLIPDDKG
jgi:hypothetical protein